MTLTFLDLEEYNNPRNRSTIVDAEQLDTLFATFRERKPFFCELSANNSYKLVLGVGRELGCAQFGRKDGRPPYFMAVGNPELERDTFVEFLAGGTASPIPTRYCMSMDTIRRIAHEFLIEGCQPGSVNWEEI